MAKISEKTLDKVRKALRKAGKKGLDAKGLMKATGLDADELKPVVNHLVNELEEVEVEGKIMTLAEESDDDEETDADEDAEETDADEDEDEDEAPKKSKKGQKKSSGKKSGGNGKGQKAKGGFSLSYATLDTLDEDDLNERIKVGVSVAEALTERGGHKDKIAAELLMRSVGKCRKMLRKLED